MCVCVCRVCVSENFSYCNRKLVHVLMYTFRAIGCVYFGV